jgi:hypothetical protein
LYYKYREKKYNTNKKKKEEEAVFCFNEREKKRCCFNIVKAKEKGSHIRKKNRKEAKQNEFLPYSSRRLFLLM